ncbi:MAG: nitroreductase family protein [Spirochaetota bacterium]
MKSLNPVEFIASLKGLLDEEVHFPESVKGNPVLQVLFRRRSVRKFQEKEIPPDVFEAVLEAARVAPSTVNMQSWSFGVFDKTTWREIFGKQMPFKGDKAVMVFGDLHRVRQALDEFPFKPLIEYTLGVMNASIAAYAMNIAAEACGVASVMLSDTGQSGFYDALYLKEKLSLPDGVFPIMTVIFGYPKSKPLGMPPKLPKNEIIFTGKYRDPDKTVMQAWFKKMMAGYRALYVTKSFKQQLNHYFSKIDEAEKGLREIIFYKPEEYKKKL